MTKEEYESWVKALTIDYSRSMGMRGSAYLEDMARMYMRIGRVKGSRHKPWIKHKALGFWSIYDLDGRIVRKLCKLLGCKPRQLVPKV